MGTFVDPFKEVASRIKALQNKTVDIDNVAFKLHYRVTFLMLLIATILVTSRQYIGEHIRCLSGMGPKEHVINTYCFFTTTFTVVKDMDPDKLVNRSIPHPGVGNYYNGSPDPIVRHAYYQWVPFLLFGQALMFYATHLIWKKLEGGRMKMIATNLEGTAYSLLDKPMTSGDKKIPSEEQRQAKIDQIRDYFMDYMYSNSTWAISLIVCEVLNLLNVLLQFYLTNKFLNGRFYNLGPEMIREGYESLVTPLDEIFPKITKCVFHQYGPSGSIQLHDAMCVMALNIINEKIYLFLWFWFVFLLVTSCLGLVYRGMTILLHARSRVFNRVVYSTNMPGKLNPWRDLYVSNHYSYTDWVFLKYLSKNVDGLVFRQILMGIAQELEDYNTTDSIKSKESKDLLDSNLMYMSE